MYDEYAIKKDREIADKIRKKLWTRTGLTNGLLVPLIYPSARLREKEKKKNKGLFFGELEKDPYKTDYDSSRPRECYENGFEKGWLRTLLSPMGIIFGNLFLYEQILSQPKESLESLINILPSNPLTIPAYILGTYALTNTASGIYELGRTLLRKIIKK